MVPRMNASLVAARLVYAERCTERSLAESSALRFRRSWTSDGTGRIRGLSRWTHPVWGIIRAIHPDCRNHRLRDRDRRTCPADRLPPVADWRRNLTRLSNDRHLSRYSSRSPTSPTWCKRSSMATLAGISHTRDPRRRSCSHPGGSSKRNFMRLRDLGNRSRLTTSGQAIRLGF